jgi:hypothetical protein
MTSVLSSRGCVCSRGLGDCSPSYSLPSRRSRINSTDKREELAAKTEAAKVHALEYKRLKSNRDNAAERLRKTDGQFSHIKTEREERPRKITSGGWCRGANLVESCLEGVSRDFALTSPKVTFRRSRSRGREARRLLQGARRSSRRRLSFSRQTRQPGTDSCLEEAAVKSRHFSLFSPFPAHQ